jgi:hypothetical protein
MLIGSGDWLFKLYAQRFVGSLALCDLWNKQIDVKMLSYELPAAWQLPNRSVVNSTELLAVVGVRRVISPQG